MNKKQKMSKFRRAHIMGEVLKKIRLYCDKRARIIKDKKTGWLRIEYSIYCFHKKEATHKVMDESQAIHLANELWGDA